MARLPRGRADAARRDRAGDRDRRPARLGVRRAGAAPRRCRRQRRGRAVGRGDPGAARRRASRRCCSRRRCAPTAWRPCGPRVGGPCSPPTAHRPTWSSTGSSASAVGPACARRPRRRWPRSRACPWWRSTCRRGSDVDTGQLDGDHVVADLTVTFGTHKVAHLVDPAAQACGVVHLVDLGLDAAGRAGRGAPAGRRRRAAARAGPVRGTSTPAASSGSAPARRPIPARRCCAPRVRCRGLAGMVRYLGSAADAVRARHPEIVVSDGRVQAWVVGSGGDADAEQALADALADGVPVVVDADALVHVIAAARRASYSPRTPASWPGCSTSSGRRWRPTSSASPVGRPRRTTRWCCSRAGTRSSPGPTDVSRVTTSGVPWLAVAGAGDVLAGLIGSLLAAGLVAVRRRVGRLVAARRRRRPGQRGRTDHRERRRRRGAAGGAEDPVA